MADDAPTAGTAPPPSDVRWEKTYPGLPAVVSHVRRDVRDVLGPCPELVADDVTLVVSSSPRMPSGTRDRALTAGRTPSGSPTRSLRRFHTSGLRSLTWAARHGTESCAPNRPTGCP